MQSVSSNLLNSKPPSSSTPGKRKKKQPKTKKEMSPPPDLPFQQQSESESSDDDEIQKSKKMKIELKEAAVPGFPCAKSDRKTPNKFRVCSQQQQQQPDNGSPSNSGLRLKLESETPNKVGVRSDDVKTTAGVSDTAAGEAASASLSFSLDSASDLPQTVDMETMDEVKTRLEMKFDEVSATDRSANSLTWRTTRGYRTPAAAAGSARQLGMRDTLLETPAVSLPDEWQKEDVTELLDRILKALPKNDHLQMKTQCEKFKWEDISFGEHSAEECKAQWLMLSKRIRRFRTLTEMATDAAQMMNEYGVISANKKQLKHRDPDCPKRPMTPFFRYYMDHYKRLKEHNPDMSAPEMTKYLSEQFKDISAKKKKKYNDKYLKDRADYGEAYEKYKQEHPEKFLQANKSSSGTNRKIGPMKPSLAYHIYTTQKVKEHLEKHPELPRKELVEAYRKRWSDMSEARRQKWVRRAMEDKIRYEKEMLEFREQHPDFVPTGRSVKFNKAEQKIKDMMDGKPVRPPPNAYALFTSITLQGGELKDIPNMERMSEVAKRWKSLTTAEKDVFVKEAEEKNNAFKSEYEEWVKTLTPEEQEKLASEERKRKKKTKDTTKRGSSDESSKTATKKSGKVKRTLYPGEPKKPPGSGYHMFTIEKLPTFSETPAKERLGRISELWRAMTDDEKAEYTRRRDKRVAKYEKALKSFKSTLTPEELENYEASKANTGKSSKSRAKNVKVEPASEDESSSSSSDESDDDDDDSSNEDEEKAPEVIVNGDQKSASSSSSEESAADDSDNGGDDGADSSDDESKSKHSDSEKENRQVPDDNNGQNNEEGSPSASSSSESESEAASKGSSSSEESGDEN